MDGASSNSNSAKAVPTREIVCIHLLGYVTHTSYAIQPPADSTDINAGSYHFKPATRDNTQSPRAGYQKCDPAR
jgi:hypothetical protein